MCRNDKLMVDRTESANWSGVTTKTVKSTGGNTKTVGGGVATSTVYTTATSIVYTVSYATKTETQTARVTTCPTRYVGL